MSSGLVSLCLLFNYCPILSREQMYSGSIGAVIIIGAIYIAYKLTEKRKAAGIGEKDG